MKNDKRLLKTGILFVNIEITIFLIMIVGGIIYGLVAELF